MAGRIIAPAQRKRKTWQRPFAREPDLWYTYDGL